MNASLRAMKSPLLRPRAPHWAVFFLVLGCQESTQESSDDASARFQTVITHENSALTAVHGTSADDVWVVGAHDAKGAVALHFDGSEWTRAETGMLGDLWWVQALAPNLAFFSGSDATVLKFEDGEFERLRTPGLGKYVVFGVWAASADDVYAVGSIAGRNGFIWHYDGNEFTDVPLPVDVPLDDNADAPPLFKVTGASADDVWIVGAAGTVLHGNATDGFEYQDQDTDERLFSVSANGGDVVMVGGNDEGLCLSGDSNEPAELNLATPEDAPILQGAWVAEDGKAWLVGAQGAMYEGRPGDYQRRDGELDTSVESLHAVWVDPSGGVWTVGGKVLSGTLDQGRAYHQGSAVPLLELANAAPPKQATCPEEAVDPVPTGSIARRWNEQLLNAIRRDIPRPTVHARNLLHTSMAMWDAWAAYDDRVDAVVVPESATAEDLDAARTEAISYASYRVLHHRYAKAVGGAASAACFDAFMEKLGFDPTDDDTDGDSPRALGNRIGQTIVDTFADDGANESNDYADPDAFHPDAPNLIVDQPGTTTTVPTVWQQLVLSQASTQNGISQQAGVQTPVGSHWAQVTPFSLERAEPGVPYLDIGTPPTDLDDRLVEAAMDVVQRGAQLDHEDGVNIDISPASVGNNPLGTNDGSGYAENPVTGEPYEPQMVARGDFARVLAEFWADGPKSETPPGHWNALLNFVSDDPNFEHRLFGEGDPLDRLSWDVHSYLALNGAMHDAAIAAWELKRYYVSARPITLIRYMAGLGQRTDPDGPSYDPSGIPLIDDLVEVITEESSASGERHEHLRRYVGEIALRAWRGEPGDREHDVGGVGWIRAADWMPYQRRTFVTPAFPGYVSGHSTFSRAAAEVLTRLTGSPYFPGGLGRYRAEPGYLVFEYGPSEPVELQWATYYDAADQAGQSRLWGGIHIFHDDFDGRSVGAAVGEHVAEFVAPYFDGTAR